MTYNPRKLTPQDKALEYQKAKKSFGIYNCSSNYKIAVQGINSLELINHFLFTKITSETICEYGILMNRNVFLDEVLILKQADKKYLLFVNNFKKVFKKLLRIRKKYPLTIVNDATKFYSSFSFYGIDANNYFKNISHNNLFKIQRQGYTYYQLIATKDEELTIFNYFVSQKFIPICLDTMKIFLYNNKVINNFNNISRKYRYKYLNTIYNIYPSKPSYYSIEVFEILDNVIIPNNNNIMDNNRKVCGKVYCSFRLPYKKYPFIIALVDSIENNMLITKTNRKEILLRKQYKNYETL